MSLRKLHEIKESKKEIVAPILDEKSLIYLSKYMKRIEKRLGGPSILCKLEVEKEDFFSGFWFTEEYKKFIEDIRNYSDKVTSASITFVTGASNFDYYKKFSEEILNDKLSESMNTLNTLIATINKGLDVLTKTSKKFNNEFERIMPGLKLFVELYKAECDAYLINTKYKNPEKKYHPCITSGLGWEELEKFNKQLIPLKKKCHEKVDTLLNILNGITGESEWSLEYKAIIEQIDVFSIWFSKSREKEHGYSNIHDACRVANQDLNFLIGLIINSPNTKIKEEYPEIQLLITSYYHHNEKKLIDLRTYYGKEYEKYIHIQETFNQKKVDSKKENDFEKIAKSAMSEIFNEREQACLNALKNIKACIKHNPKKNLYDQESKMWFNEIITTIEKINPVKKRELITEAKQEIISETMVPKRDVPCNLGRHALDWFSLKIIYEEIKPLIDALNKEKYTILTVMTEKEMTRLDIVNLIKNFIYIIDSSKIPDGKIIGKANTALDEILLGLRSTPASIELRSDKNLSKYFNSFFAIYLQQLHKSIRQINTEYYKSCLFIDAFQNDIDQLDQKQAQERSITRSPSAFFSMIKTTCKKALHEENPYAQTIAYIAVLISALSNRDNAKNFSMEALMTYHMIFTHINTALMEQDALNSSASQACIFRSM